MTSPPDIVIAVVERPLELVDALQKAMAEAKNRGLRPRHRGDALPTPLGAVDFRCTGHYRVERARCKPGTQSGLSSCCFCSVRDDNLSAATFQSGDSPVDTRPD